MAKKNWIWEGESDFIVRLYIRNTKSGQRTICMKVLKMPEKLMGKDVLVSARHEKVIIASRSYRPRICEGYLYLPKEKSKVGVATWSVMWGLGRSDKEVIERHRSAIKALGGIIVGEGSELTDDKKKADTQETRRIKRAYNRAVPKPKNESIFGRSLVKSKAEEIKDA